MAIDPVLVACHLGTALQSIVSRNVPPQDMAVLSITRIQGGDAYNVIPQVATMAGTVRAFKTETMHLVEANMKRLATSIAAGFGAEATVDFRVVFVPLMNDIDHAQAFADAAADLVGDAKVDRNKPPANASEDFSYMLEKVPGAYINLGNGEDSAPVHNPAYNFNDAAIPYGVALFASIVERKLPKWIAILPLPCGRGLGEGQAHDRAHIPNPLSETLMFTRPDATTLTIYLDGAPLTAREGDSVAAALLSHGIHTTRQTPVSGAPRGPYCMMGACFDCLAVVDGQPGVQTCLDPGARRHAHRASARGAIPVGHPMNPDLHHHRRGSRRHLRRHGSTRARTVRAGARREPRAWRTHLAGLGNARRQGPGRHRRPARLAQIPRLGCRLRAGAPVSGQSNPTAPCSGARTPSPAPPAPLAS